MKVTLTGGEPFQQDIEKEFDHGKGILIVPRRLMDKIDINRDSCDRADFIELCIDALLEQGEIHTEVTQPLSGLGIAENRKADSIISRSEFEEFKKGVKDIMNAYINLLLGSTSKLTNNDAQGKQEYVNQRVREFLE